MKPLDFKANYTLENEIVRLRPLLSDDLEILSVFAELEPEIWKYSLQPADSKENMKAYIERALKERENKSSYPFIVFDKRQNEYAGCTRFYDYQEWHNTVQLGYTWYGKAYQGTGLNKNCKYLMLDFAFDQLGLDRVEFRAHNGNKRSIAAMKSIGCTVEGVLRSNYKIPTGRRDSIILSILKQEWDDSVMDKLKAKC